MLAGSEQPPGPASPQELALRIGDGTLRVAGQLWHPAGGVAPRARILAVHGTLDNCASFDPLASQLAAAGYCVFAMDLTGHGRSDWHAGGFYHPTAWVLEILQTLTALGGEWVDGAQPLVLMGHSLGASLCSLVAGTFPERFSAAILIDGLGWWAARTEEQLKELAKAEGYAGQSYRNAGPDFYKPFSCTRRAVESIVALDDKRAQGPKEYESLEAAVQARVKATESSPVGQRISWSAASAIVARGTRSLPSGSVVYTHDSRISACTRTIVMPDEEALGYLLRIPRILLLHGDADHTWPGIHQRTAARLPLMDATRVEVHFFAGEAHHLHADSPKLLLPTVLTFLAGLETIGRPLASRM